MTADAASLASRVDSDSRLAAVCELVNAAVGSDGVVELIDEITGFYERLGYAGVFAYVHDGLDEHLVCAPDQVDLGAVHQARSSVKGPDDVLRMQIRLRDGRLRDARVVGIWKGMEVVGVLGMIDPPDAEPDEAGDQIAIAVARQIAATVERASARGRAVYQAQVTKEYQIAADVQRSLIPTRRPTCEGVDLGAAYVPSTFVGGDIYDWHAVDDHVLLAHVGDVSGKGMSAAVVMAMAQMLARSSVRAGHVCPEALAEVVNANLYDQLVEIGAFVTMFFMQYDASRRILSFSNAGHSPVVIRHKGLEPRVIEAHGPPIGVLETLQLEREEAPFQPGDVLVACSDGVVEQRNLDGELFGYERLLGLVDDLDHLSASDLAARVMSEVTEFAAGTPSDDDRAILVLKPTSETGGA